MPYSSDEKENESSRNAYGPVVSITNTKRSRSVMKLSGTNINFNPAQINNEGGVTISESENSSSLIGSKKHKEF